ncbi:adenine methyltransferase [Candidatus Dependentiae bacterium]|nr:adenine methyltransferase [Candidatus Dependentiae bacterium]
MDIKNDKKSSKYTTRYSTTLELFKPLQKEFGITLDVSATQGTAKCSNFYNVEDDPLKREWNGVCWMCPPFRGHMRRWVKKAYSESLKGNIVICLLPVNSNSTWWDEYVMKGEIRFIRGEVLLEEYNKRIWRDMCIVIFGKEKHKLGNTIQPIKRLRKFDVKV